MFVTLMFLMTATRWSQCQDTCQVCDCLPPDKPVQAFCIGNSKLKVFEPTTSPDTSSLELMYISGMKTVNILQKTFETEKPFDLLIQNCTDVHIYNQSMNHLRSLLLRNVKVARVGSLGDSDLWSVILENIQQLTLDDSSCFLANYNVKIGNVESLTISATQNKNICDNVDLQFTLLDSVLNPIQKGSLSVCGNKIKVHRNIFKCIEEGGFQISAETSIKVTDNHFEHLSKKVFNLSSPSTHISGNTFDILPAGALSDVSILEDVYFTNNTIQDIDLGGVLLDMSWGIIMEDNMVDCDCASKRTSILNPKQDMLYLTNFSYETLQTIFINNYCHFNCTVSLKAFSLALIEKKVCLSNKTQLKEESLCDMIILPEYTSESESELSSMSAASRIEFIVPLSIILVTILITSSVCYGCKEMKTFKFVFKPHQDSGSKLPRE